MIITLFTHFNTSVSPHVVFTWLGKGIEIEVYVIALQGWNGGSRDMCGINEYFHRFLVTDRSICPEIGGATAFFPVFASNFVQFCEIFKFLLVW